MGPYSAYVAPATDALKSAVAAKVPGTAIPVLIVLHAIRLSLGYQKATRRSTSWLQGLFSVCALPMASGIVATLLTGSLPGFLQSDVVIPTYMATYLVIHNSGIIRGILNSVPPQILDLVTLPADIVLKTSVICSAGVDGITSHYSAAIKHNWFAPIFTGGSVGSAGFMLLNTFNLFSPVWTLNTRLDSCHWEIYGPYVLSLLYLALQGSNPQINNLVWSLSQGVVGGKRARYFTREEARTVVTCIHLAVEGAKKLGLWSGRLPGGIDRSARAATAATETKVLGGAATKKTV